MESGVKKSLVFAMMIVASAIGSAAQAEETAKPQEAKPAAEKKICRTEQVTGSLARRNRVCMTKAEWDKLAADTQKQMQDFHRGESGGAQSGPFGN